MSFDLNNANYLHVSIDHTPWTNMLLCYYFIIILMFTKNILYVSFPTDVSQYSLLFSFNKY